MVILMLYLDLYDFNHTSILVERPIDILDKKFLKEIIISNNVTVLYLPVTLVKINERYIR